MRQINPKLTYVRALLLIRAADKYGYEYNINPYVILAIIWQETDFRNISGDHGKAKGYGQLHRATFGYLQMYDGTLTDYQYNHLEILPVLQVRLIAYYLRILMNTSAHGSIMDAISMYNGNVQVFNNYAWSVYQKVIILRKVAQTK
jgi:hypothetical protein